MEKLEEVLEKLPEEYRIPLFEAFTIIREEKIELIAKEEILKIWDTLKEISEGNKKAEERLTRLEASVAELAEAQKRTEQRVNELAEAQKRTEKRLEELAEAQKKAEERLTRLEASVAELVEAQKRTEQRVNELAEAQKKAEERLTRLESIVAELAEAQKKTEREIQKLTGTVSNLQKEVGGLSHGFGHMLEDKAILKLPEILKKKFKIILDGELERGFLENKNGIEEEVNVFGFGKKNRKRIFILGEGKARFGEKDLKEFEKKISRFKTIYSNIFPVVITYVFSKAKFEEKLKEKGIFYLLSYELERI